METKTDALPGAGWILTTEFCLKYQQNPNVVQKRVHDGSWLRGEIYSSPNGGESYINEALAVAWLEKRGKLPAVVE